MTAVKIPDDLWDDDSEGAISAWLYDDGDRVEKGSVIAEVMNEKVASELVAPASGALAILSPAEEPVRKGQLVARIVA
jgi:pyruvate/2-oxoglutarate dehydrogenase complex dihydrolipoamide acyltransferase (E2) component